MYSVLVGYCSAIKQQKGNKMLDKNSYKYQEVKDYFDNFINENSNYLDEIGEDLHHECFNTTHYIIGTYKATQWLGDQVFSIINIIKHYEEENFGQVTTDFSNPEQVVNMYVYILGECIVSDYQAMAA